MHYLVFLAGLHFWIIIGVALAPYLWGHSDDLILDKLRRLVLHELKLIQLAEHFDAHAFKPYFEVFWHLEEDCLSFFFVVLPVRIVPQLAILLKFFDLSNELIQLTEARISRTITVGREAESSVSVVTPSVPWA